MSAELRLHRLPYGTFRWSEDGLVIAQVDDGVELRAAEVERIHRELETVLSRPHLILVDRRHRYSLDHDALFAIARSPNLVARAIVAYDFVAATIARFEKVYRIPVEVFLDRGEALEWLGNEWRRKQGSPPPPALIQLQGSRDYSATTA